MKDLEQLPSIFTPEEAMKHGISAYTLKKLLKDGLLEQPDRGIYVKSTADDFGERTDFLIAIKKIHTKSAICLTSALIYHHLSEAVPSTVWLLVDAKTRSTKHGISLLRKKDPKWDVGIVDDGSILVTNIERTLIECLIFKNKVGYNEAYYALKTALDKTAPKTTINKIIQESINLDLFDRIKLILEPFLYE